MRCFSLATDRKRTTIYLPHHTHVKLKITAAQEGKTMGEIIELGLKIYFKKDENDESSN